MRAAVMEGVREPVVVRELPDPERIGKGKAHKPYEFGVKVTIATTNRRCKDGQFVLHAKALPGNPYDGHTLADVIEETQALTGREVERAYADKGYRGHDAPKPLRVYLSGQRRGVHGATTGKVTASVCCGTSAAWAPCWPRTATRCARSPASATPRRRRWSR